MPRKSETQSEDCWGRNSHSSEALVDGLSWLLDDTRESGLGQQMQVCCDCKPGSG